MLAAVSPANARGGGGGEGFGGGSHGGGGFVGYGGGHGSADRGFYGHGHYYGHRYYGFYGFWPGWFWYPYWWPAYDYYDYYGYPPPYYDYDNGPTYFSGGNPPLYPQYDGRDYLMLGHDSGKALRLKTVSQEWLVDYLRAYIINAPLSVRDDSTPVAPPAVSTPRARQSRRRLNTGYACRNSNAGRRRGCHRIANTSAPTVSDTNRCAGTCCATPTASCTRHGPSRNRRAAASSARRLRR